VTVTGPQRFAVPLEQLDGVRVDDTQQVQEQSAPVHPDSGPGGHPFGDGMADADGD
jgi:hypothetical protein